MEYGILYTPRPMWSELSMLETRERLRKDLSRESKSCIKSAQADLIQCDASCPRRWRGCKCRADPTNISKKCIPGKCPCRLQHRHCDPGLCACDPPYLLLNAACGQGETEHFRLPGFHSSKGPACQNLDTRQLGEPVSDITNQHNILSIRKPW
jgi:hypothetical protein